MKTDNPRSAMERLRQKAKDNAPVKRMVDCGDYYLFERGSKSAPAASYRVMKKNGKVKKIKPVTPAVKRRKRTASAAGGILKAVIRKVL